MSPREKGRYLRKHGWTSTAYAGVLGWSDPRDRSRGSISTKEAYEIQCVRLVIGMTLDAIRATPDRSAARDE